MTPFTPPCWSEITAVFGGRFDPPHLGHREAVRGLFKIPGIKRVLVIPTASPPHKPTTATSVQRAEMAALNFCSTSNDPFPPEVQIDRRELERAQLKPNLPSYSYDTLLELQPHFSKRLAFVIGTDQLEQLATWYRFPDILSLSHWIVLVRKPIENNPSSLDLTFKTLEHWKASGLIRSTPESQTWLIQKGGSTYLTLVHTDAPAISSSFIRESLAKTGIPPKGAISEEILTYLKVHRLYGI